MTVLEWLGCIGGLTAMLSLSLRLRNLRSRLGPRMLENLVELAAIEPHATTLRAVVDLDTVAFAHQQRGSVGGAVHVSQPRGASEQLSSCRASSREILGESSGLRAGVVCWV